MSNNCSKLDRTFRKPFPNRKQNLHMQMRIVHYPSTRRSIQNWRRPPTVLETYFRLRAKRAIVVPFAIKEGITVTNGPWRDTASQIWFIKRKRQAKLRCCDFAPITWYACERKSHYSRENWKNIYVYREWIERSRHVSYIDDVYRL